MRTRAGGFDGGRTCSSSALAPSDGLVAQAVEAAQRKRGLHLRLLHGREAGALGGGTIVCRVAAGGGAAQAQRAGEPGGQEGAVRRRCVQPHLQATCCRLGPRAYEHCCLNLWNQLYYIRISQLLLFDEHPEALKKQVVIIIENQCPIVVTLQGSVRLW